MIDLKYIKFFIILFSFCHWTILSSLYSNKKLFKQKKYNNNNKSKQKTVLLCFNLNICDYSEIFPYLVVLIGFENVIVLTKSVVATPIDLPVKYRIAEGNSLLRLVCLFFL